TAATYVAHSIVYFSLSACAGVSSHKSGTNNRPSTSGCNTAYADGILMSGFGFSWGWKTNRRWNGPVNEFKLSVEGSTPSPLAIRGRTSSTTTLFTSKP